MLMESGDETYPGKPEMEVMKNSVSIYMLCPLEPHVQHIKSAQISLLQ
jgi:hypothetical protein